MLIQQTTREKRPCRWKEMENDEKGERENRAKKNGYKIQQLKGDARCAHTRTNKKQ